MKRRRPSGNLVWHVGDHHAGLGEQLFSKQFGGLEVQGVEDALRGDKLRHYDGDRLVGLAGGYDLFEIVQQRLQEEAIGGIDDDEARALSPAVPFYLGFSVSAESIATWTAVISSDNLRAYRKAASTPWCMLLTGTMMRCRPVKGGGSP